MASDLEGKRSRPRSRRRESDGIVDLGLAKDVLCTGRAVVAVNPEGTSVLIVLTRHGVRAFENRADLGPLLATASIRRDRLICAHYGHPVSAVVRRMYATSGWAYPPVCAGIWRGSTKADPCSR